MRTLYIISTLVITILSACNVETYISQEFTIGHNNDYVPDKSEIRLQGDKCWIDGVRVQNYERTDTTLIFKCSDNNDIIFKF